MTRIYWALRGGESIEVYDGSEPAAENLVMVYRIGVDRLKNAEIKILRQSSAPKIINADSRSHVIDIATSGKLFLEAIGDEGLAFGWYEAVV